MFAWPTRRFIWERRRRRKVICIKRRSSTRRGRRGAGAIHPGYGFLSENADFADACADAGIIFVGPPGHVMRKLGEKTAAKRVAVEASVPIVPGYNAGIETRRRRRALPARSGIPSCSKRRPAAAAKASASSIAREDLSLRCDWPRARRRGPLATATVYMEKAVTPARHIEVQIIADTHGNVVHLGERECSIQRRHQKLIEESPSVALDDELRARFTARPWRWAVPPAM